MSDSVISRTVTCQAPLSMEFSEQEYWTGLPFPTWGDLPDPGIEPCIGRQILYHPHHLGGPQMARVGSMAQDHIVKGWCWYFHLVYLVTKLPPQQYWEITEICELPYWTLGRKEPYQPIGFSLWERESSAVPVTQAHSTLRYWPCYSRERWPSLHAHVLRSGNSPQRRRWGQRPLSVTKGRGLSSWAESTATCPTPLPQAVAPWAFHLPSFHFSCQLARILMEKLPSFGIFIF